MCAEELYEVLVKDRNLLDVFRELGRRMTFGKVIDGGKAKNFDAKFLEINFTVANTEHKITHGLGRTPVGLLQVGDLSLANVVGLRLEATRAATSTNLFLKCSEAKPVFVLIW